MGPGSRYPGRSERIRSRAFRSMARVDGRAVRDGSGACSLVGRGATVFGTRGVSGLISAAADAQQGRDPRLLAISWAFRARPIRGAAARPSRSTKLLKLPSGYLVAAVRSNDRRRRRGRNRVALDASSLRASGCAESGSRRASTTTKRQLDQGAGTGGSSAQWAVAPPAASASEAILANSPLSASSCGRTCCGNGARNWMRRRSALKRAAQVEANLAGRARGLALPGAWQSPRFRALRRLGAPARQFSCYSSAGEGLSGLTDGHVAVWRGYLACAERRAHPLYCRPALNDPRRRLRRALRGRHGCAPVCAGWRVLSPDLLLRWIVLARRRTRRFQHRCCLF